MTESEIYKMIRSECTDRKWYLIDLRRAGVRGLPDCLVMTPNGPHFIEIKTKADRLRPLQKLFLRMAGYRYMTVIHEQDSDDETRAGVRNVFEALDMMSVLW